MAKRTSSISQKELTVAVANILTTNKVRMDTEDIISRLMSHGIEVSLNELDVALTSLVRSNMIKLTRKSRIFGAHLGKQEVEVVAFVKDCSV